MTAPVFRFLSFPAMNEPSLRSGNDEREHKDEFFQREFSWLKLVRLRKRSDKGDER